MFESLKFWKKKDEFDFNLDLDPGSGKEKEPFFKDPLQDQFSAENPFSQNEHQPNQPNQPNPFQMQFQEKNQFSGQQQPQQMYAPASQRDIDLLSSKLDTVKALLENITQRLDRMEKNQPAEKKIERRW